MCSQTAELLDSHSRGVRPEESTPLSRPALVRIEGGGHAAIQWLGWRQLDATDD
jgi:hypothetical protein